MLRTRMPIVHRQFIWCGLLLCCGLFATAAIAGGAGESAPTCPTIHLTPPTFSAFSSFGFSLDIDGDRFIAGRPHFGAFGGGAAEVYRRVDGAWTFEQQLLASDGPVMGDEFGNRVTIHGDRAMVRARVHMHALDAGVGAVYVFRRADNRWLFEQELVPEQVGLFGGDFGRSLGLLDDVAMVGASSETARGIQHAGQVHVYRRSGTKWTESEILSASDPRGSSLEGASFGWALSVRGDYALIAAPADDATTKDSGAAYVFHREGNTWVEKQKLVADNDIGLGSGDQFGYSVSLSESDHGLVALIGALNDDDGGVNSGSAYIFRHDADRDFWFQEQELMPEPPDVGASFGRSVAIDGDWAVVGANHSDLFKAQFGAAFVYHYDGGQWNLADTLLPDQGPFFGWSVSLSGNTAIVSAHGEFSQSGAVYIHNINPLFADLNCDNHVNGLDLMILLGSWGPLGKRNADQLPGAGAGAGAGAADLDDNGIVNGFDLAILLGAWE